jgi:hypothetical protein
MTKTFLNYWVFVALAVFFGSVAVLSLRANNLEAVHLRDKVLEVDKANGDVESALRELRTYVYGHMHTDLSSGTNVYPPVQLKYTYDRLVEAEKKRVQSEMAKVYLDAQRICEQQNSTDFSGRNRVPCIEQYVTSHTISEKPIADDVYKFDFASPSWSPDAAGISLVLSGLFAALGAASFLTQQWLKGRLL